MSVEAIQAIGIFIVTPVTVIVAICYLFYLGTKV